MAVVVVSVPATRPATADAGPPVLPAPRLRGLKASLNGNGADHAEADHDLERGLGDRRQDEDPGDDARDGPHENTREIGSTDG